MTDRVKQTLRSLTEQIYVGLNSFIFERNDEHTRHLITQMLRKHIRQISEMYGFDVDLEQIGLFSYPADPTVLEANAYTIRFLRMLNEHIAQEDQFETDARLENL
jgi:hypothetical protein